MDAKVRELADALWQISDEADHAFGTDADNTQEVFEVNMKNIKAICENALKKYPVDQVCEQ